MASMAMNMTGQMTGFGALNFAAPMAKAEAGQWGITASDIGRYRTHKKRRKHDTIPSWVVATAVDALLGDRLMARFFGGLLGPIGSKDPNGDLANTIESLTEMFQSAAETTWDMATGDDLAQTQENNLVQNNMSPTPAQNDQSIIANSAGRLGAWRQQNQDNKPGQGALGYQNTLKFAAP